MAGSIFSQCTANSYGQLTGTVGEIQTEHGYWVVEVYDKKGNQNHIRIPLSGVDQAGFDSKILEKTILSGVEIDVVTGPKHTVRRLQIKQNRVVLPLIPSTKDSSAKPIKDKTQ